MTVDFKIKPSSDCSITIKDTTSYKSQEVNELDLYFKYSDTYGFIILQRCKTDETTSSEPIFDLHDGSSISIPITSDGHYVIIYHVIPTKEWFEDMLEVGFPCDIIYYSDGSKFYKYDIPDKTTIEVTWDLIGDEEATVPYTKKDFVSICYLKKCYIDFCLLIFNDKAFSSCWANSNVDSELVYKRDLTWMALNVIKYLVEQELLCEAERYIEILESCNGLCISSSSSSNSKGCGCSK